MMKLLTLKEIAKEAVLESIAMNEKETAMAVEILEEHLPKYYSNIWVAGFGDTKVVIAEQEGKFYLFSGFCLLRGFGEIGNISRCISGDLANAYYDEGINTLVSDIRFGTSAVTDDVLDKISKIEL